MKHASSLQKEAVNPAAIGKGLSRFGKYLGLYGNEAAKGANKIIITPKQVAAVPTPAPKPAPVKVTHTNMDKYFAPPIDDAQRIRASGGKNPYGQQLVAGAPEQTAWLKQYVEEPLHGVTKRVMAEGGMPTFSNYHGPSLPGQPQPRGVYYTDPGGVSRFAPHASNPNTEKILNLGGNRSYTVDALPE